MEEITVTYNDGNRMTAKGYCELTTDMDNYLLGKSKLFHTYISGYPDNCCGGQLFSLRVPGSTCGYFVTDNYGIIKDYDLYPSSYPLYRVGVYEILNEYLGKKVVVAKNI